MIISMDSRRLFVQQQPLGRLLLRLSDVLTAFSSTLNLPLYKLVITETSIRCLAQDPNSLKRFDFEVYAPAGALHCIRHPFSKLSFNGAWVAPNGNPTEPTQHPDIDPRVVRAIALAWSILHSEPGRRSRSTYATAIAA